MYTLLCLQCPLRVTGRKKCLEICTDLVLLSQTLLLSSKTMSRSGARTDGLFLATVCTAQVASFSNESHGSFLPVLKKKLNHRGCFY
jgi:hypothetical protein